MRISKEIVEALKNNQPVVALETTIISHGMPYPKNVECALLVEKTIRDNGAIPATIGIIDGEPIIGMSKDEIEKFAKISGICKVSRRDIGIVVAKKLNGATTVSGTMILAKKAGIDVFVTGGIGGVHKGAQQTFDISADLEELSQTDVAVVCAGPKAILDLELTAEVLETKGVPLIGYNTDKMPAFYTRTSSVNVDYNASTPKEIAEIIFSTKKYGNSGVLICNPVPDEYAMDEKEINKAIETAQKEAIENKVSGKNLTPFLLKRIVELTKGDSLETNIKLIVNNATLGAKIAVEYSKLNGRKQL